MPYPTSNPIAKHDLVGPALNEDNTTLSTTEDVIKRIAGEDQEAAPPPHLMRGCTRAHMRLQLETRIDGLAATLEDVRSNMEHQKRTTEDIQEQVVAMRAVLMQISQAVLLPWGSAKSMNQCAMHLSPGLKSQPVRDARESPVGMLRISGERVQRSNDNVCEASGVDKFGA